MYYYVYYVIQCITMEYYVYYEFYWKEHWILCDTMLYSVYYVIQCNTMEYYVYYGYNGVLCVLCILWIQWSTMYTMLYSVYYVIQCNTMEYNGLRPWGHSPLFFKRKEKENGGRKKNFHVKNVFGVNACREEYALHPYHISPIFI